MTGSYKSAAANFMGFGYMKKRKKPLEKDVTYFFTGRECWGGVLKREKWKERGGCSGRAIDFFSSYGWDMQWEKGKIISVLCWQARPLNLQEINRCVWKGGRPYLVSRRPLFNLETSTLGTRGLEGPFGYKPWSWGWSGMHPQQRDTVISCSHPIKVRGPRAMLDH